MYRSGRGAGKSSGRNRPGENYGNNPRRRRGFVSPQTKSFAYGVGVGILATVMFPQIKEGIKPAASGAAKGIMNIAEKLQEMAVGVREGIEDIVAEARFENLKNSLEKEILEDVVEEVVEDIIT